MQMNTSDKDETDFARAKEKEWQKNDKRETSIKRQQMRSRHKIHDKVHTGDSFNPSLPLQTFPSWGKKKKEKKKEQLKLNSCAVCILGSVIK